MPNTKKYISLSKLSTFLDNLKESFASITHTHTISEISDYEVDLELSPDSNNPVANKTLDAEFEAIGTAMAALESAIDDKADGDHTHDIGDINELQGTLDAIDESISEKSKVQMITADSSEFLSTLNIHRVTQEEYDQIVESGNAEENALYLTPYEEVDLSGYVTKDELDNKADKNHDHDNIYYTEAEIDTKIDTVSQSVIDLSKTIITNYNESIIGLSVNGTTVTYIKGDGSVHTFETQDTDTTYSLGTDEVTGLTKLYATTGNAEDGTMTQKAIKTELDKKVGVTVDDSQNILIFTI